MLFQSWYLNLNTILFYTMVNKFKYHMLFGQWYLNFSTIFFYTMVMKFKYHSEFRQWYLNFSTIPCTRMVQKFHYLPSVKFCIAPIDNLIWALSYRAIANLATSDCMRPRTRRFCLLAFSVPHQPCLHQPRPIFGSFPPPAHRPEAVPHEARSLSGTVSMLITPFLADFHRLFLL